MHDLDLNGDGWTLRTTSSEAPESIRGRDIAAAVPGCVHTDLLRANLIPDPLVADNELHVQWIGEADWEYRRSFVLTEAHLAAKSLDLTCHGLDTVADLSLNGIAIGSAMNMHHPHRFDLKPAARVGYNELFIRFRSPLKHIRAESERLGPRPINGDWEPYVFIRKSASNFGWDWAPKLATCGIWQPLRVEAGPGVRIAASRPLVRCIHGDTWAVDCAVDLEWAAGAEFNRPPTLSVSLESGQTPIVARASIVPGTSTVTVSLTVDRPRLWWPRGWGEQNLYQLNVSLDGLGGVDTRESAPATIPLARQEHRIGFREALLNTKPDEHGTPFEIAINGRRIFCQGANWIPEGPYPGMASSHTLRTRVEQAAAANMNMLRVWGGGFYESDEFYRACDELGILVWQDFMFACAMYPEEPPYPALVEAEARHQVSRLSWHPSVVLWCGGNECTWAHESWGHAPGERPWKERLADKSWGAHYYFDLLPRVVGELDPTRPYWPNSPWPGRDGLGGNHADHGDRHTWDLRLDGYTSIVPRFISEYGHQASSNHSTLLTALKPEDLRLNSPLLEHHQRGTGGTQRHIDSSILEHFRKPRDFDEWHYLSQVLQARAVRIGLEWARVNQPHCMGVLVWQLNDCWPGMSWSLLDSEGRDKPAAHAFRAAAEPRRLMIYPQDGGLQLFACNNTDSPWSESATLSRLHFSGEPLQTVAVQVNVEPRCVQRVGSIASAVGQPKDPTRELVVAELAQNAQIHTPIEGRATHFYLKDRELHYPRPQLELDRRAFGRHSLRIAAKTLMRDVIFNADRTKGFTLGGGIQFPGPVTFLPGDFFGDQAEPPGDKHLQPGAFDLADEVIRPPVLWCANWFGAVDYSQP